MILFRESDIRAKIKQLEVELEESKYDDGMIGRFDYSPRTIKLMNHIECWKSILNEPNGGL